MVLKADRERVKALLTETITLLCKNGLNYQSEFAIEALIGITLDRDDVFLVSIKETICSDLGIDKDYDLHDDRRDDRREFHIETTRTSRVEATRISQEDLKDGLESAPDLSIMVQLDKSDNGRLEDTPNGSSALGPQKLFRSMHADNSSMDVADTQASQSSDSTPLSFGMRDFDTGTSTTGGGDTSRREHSADRSDHKHGMDRSDHIQQPVIKRQRTDDSGDRSVKEEEDSDDDVVVIKEEAGLDTLSCQMDAYNRTGMFDTSGSVSHDAISGMTAAANVLPLTLTLSSSAPVFSGCSSWDQLPAISAQHSLPPSTANSYTTMSNTPSQQMSQLPPAMTSSNEVYLLWASIAFAILRTDGSFVSARVVKRRHQRFSTSAIAMAMGWMTHARNSAEYVGEMRHLVHKVKIFYKCPPSLISETALRKYGLTRNSYQELYCRDPRPPKGGPFDWNAYFATAMQNSPFNTSHAAQNP